MLVGGDGRRLSVRGLPVASLLAAALMFAVALPRDVCGQTPLAPQGPASGPPKGGASFVIGEVTGVDVSELRMIVRTDGGALVTILLEEKTTYLKVPATDQTPAIEKGVTIALGVVGIGDRVLAQVTVGEGVNAPRARRVLVMSKADIVQKQERERAEWRSRGMSGTIAALDPVNKEITVSVRAVPRGRQQNVIVNASGESVEFARYAPGSVKFTDARPSSFAELRVGDQVRALGDKSSDGLRFNPEKVMSGAFRTIGGTVTGVDQASREIKVTDIQKRQQFTIALSNDTQLKRLPAEIARRFGQELSGSSPGTQAPPASRSSTQPRPNEDGRDAPSDGNDADLQSVIEHLPVITIAELKPGDMVIASTASSADATHVVAAVLVAGVEPLLNAAKLAQSGATRQNRRPVSTSINFGIGLP